MVTPINPNPPGYVDKTHLRPGHFGKPFILNRVFDLLVLMIDVLQRTAAAQANRLNFLTQWQKAYTDQLNQIHAFVAGNNDQHGIPDLTKLGNATTITGAGGILEGRPVPGFVYSHANNVFLVSGAHTFAVDANLPFDPVLQTGVNPARLDRYYDLDTGFYPYIFQVSGFKGAIDSNTSAATKMRADLTTVNSTYTQQIQGNLNVVSNDSKQIQTNVNQTNDSVQSQADMATSILQQLSTILTAITQG